jgi:cytochrome oxidase Cu insertion factor (SCO1/SenC/PrrC family)
MTQCAEAGWSIPANCGRGENMSKFLVVLLLAASLAPGSRAANKKEEMPPPKIKVGDMAPDFTLQDQNGNKVSLHDYRGKKNVALAFYIFAFTGG